MDTNLQSDLDALNQGLKDLQTKTNLVLMAEPSIDLATGTIVAHLKAIRPPQPEPAPETQSDAPQIDANTSDKAEEAEPSPAN